MADREESIPAATVEPEAPKEPPRDRWAGWQPWRATFMYHVTDPEVHQALRVLGGQIYEWALDWTGWPDSESPIILTELRATVQELRDLQGFLDETVAMPSGSDDRTLRRLQVRAEQWGAALGRIADEIEQAVAHE